MFLVLLIAFLPINFKVLHSLAFSIELIVPQVYDDIYT